MPSLAWLHRLRLAPASPVQPPSTARRRSGLRTKLRFVNACPRPCRVVRPSKSFALCRLRRPATCILAGFACRPWRGCIDFDWPQPRHPCRVVRPSKSFALCRLRRPATCILAGFACRPWRGCIDFDWPQPRHPCRVVRPSKSFALCRLRRPGLTLPTATDSKTRGGFWGRGSGSWVGGFPGRPAFRCLPGRWRSGCGFQFLRCRRGRQH